MVPPRSLYPTQRSDIDIETAPTARALESHEDDVHHIGIVAMDIRQIAQGTCNDLAY